MTMDVDMLLPRVSILIPNLNGQWLLEQCLSAVAALEYPKNRIECIVIDNGSADGSVYYVRTNHPDVHVLCLNTNVGYAEAINRGCDSASGEVLFLLNNDAQPAPECLLQLVRPIVRGDASCTTAKILSKDDASVQFAGGGMNFHGIAFEQQDSTGPLDDDSVQRECLFGCGGAMAINRAAFRSVGGMDRDFFAYFEDVDLGWRLWIMGYKVRYVPQAEVFHRRSATSKFIGLSKLRVLHIRNPLLMIYKNYEREYLRRILPVALILTARRTWYLADLDSSPFRIDNEPQLVERLNTEHALRLAGVDDEAIKLPRLAVSDIVAINDWISMMPGLNKKRKWIQERRVRPDSEIVRMFVEPFRYCEDKDEYRSLQDTLCREMDVDALFADVLPPKGVYSPRG